MKEGMSEEEACAVGKKAGHPIKKKQTPYDLVHACCYIDGTNHLSYANRDIHQPAGLCSYAVTILVWSQVF
jgi:hypothetical protein